MARQPIVGGDNNAWGTVLDQYLSVSLNTDGTLNPAAWNPMTTPGDLITGGTSGVATRLPVGSNGQVLSVSGTTLTWSNSLSNPMTTKGDIIVGGTSGATTRLPIGTPGQFLGISGGTPTWALPSTAFALVQPSGDSTGATDTAAINAALANTGLVQLTADTYFINAPLVIPGNTLLAGAVPTTYSGDNVQGAWTGTMISPTATFNKGSYTFPAAVFLGDGHGTAGFEGPGIQDLLINGTNGPTGLAGLVAYGPVQAITVRRMGVWRAKADGIGIYTSGSGKPDGGAFDTIIIQSCNSGNGMVMDGADMDVAAVHSQGNGLDGFVITHANNTFRGCRSDHNNNGYTTGTSATGAVFNTIKLIGCSTQGNNFNGLNVTTGESTGVSLTAPVICSGCSFQGDGANGGSGGGGYAGVAASGTTVVILNGCTVTVDTTDASGGSPQYAIATAAAGSSNGTPQLVQVMGGIYGSLHTGAGTPQVNDAGPAQLLSYSFHGYSGGALSTGSTIALFQKNPL